MPPAPIANRAVESGTRAFGLDLAWSERNLTGACVLDGRGVVIDEQLLGSDDEILDWMAPHFSEDHPVVIAIDAPLQVPNETGRRPCESELSSAYGARGASTHSANRSLFNRVHGGIRGEDLVERFKSHGFGGPWADSARTVFEVYPHPALIEVFSLERRHRYKVKRGFRVAERRIGLRELDDMLATLAHEDPPLVSHRMDITDAVRGRALKAVEDQLDARICAWMALLWATAGPEAFRVFGDEATGHIAVPLHR